MNPLIIYMLIGFASGIILFPIGLWLVNLFRRTKERRRIKRLMRQGKFLVPIDPKDYDTKSWQGKKYGNINPEDNTENLTNLNRKLFKKSVESTDDSFIHRINEYIKEARKIGYTDEQIKEEFRKKSYTEDLIKKVFENGR